MAECKVADLLGPCSTEQIVNLAFTGGLGSASRMVILAVRIFAVASPRPVSRTGLNGDTIACLSWPQVGRMPFKGHRGLLELYRFAGGRWIASCPRCWPWRALVRVALPEDAN